MRDNEQKRYKILEIEMNNSIAWIMSLTFYLGLLTVIIHNSLHRAVSATIQNHHDSQYDGTRDCQTFDTSNRLKIGFKPNYYLSMFVGLAKC